MQKIKILSSHEAQKIAAGEVIERPANIVKELLENSVDAGATQISVYVANGGRKQIRVIDNGCGMSVEDAQICFVKHATSKINSIDDLETVATFGFRGEALASISAVSRVTLRTREATYTQGVEIKMQDGIQTMRVMACNQGAEIIVDDLFFNIPARQKFLKTAQTEYRHIAQLMYAFCLDYPHIHFKFFSENSVIFNYPAVTTLLDRCIQLWQPEIAQQLIEVCNERVDKTISLSGVISDHQFGAYDRSNIFFLVNKRWIKNQPLCSALLKGYHNIIAAGRYPIAIFDIHIDPMLLDINIHPRKEEVRFMHPRIVEQMIQQTVHKALENRLSQQLKKEVSCAPFYNKLTTNDLPSAQEIFLKNFDAQRPLPQVVTSTGPAPDQHQLYHEQQPTVEQLQQSNITSELHATQQHIREISSPFSQKTVDLTSEITIIGQYNKTYILVEDNDGLLIIDQHAAHERILYELFTDRFKQVATVTLLFPHIISLNQQDMHALSPYFSLFIENGIGVELFDTEKIVIRSTPVYLKDCPIDELFYQTAARIHELQDLDKESCIKQITEKLHAQMACKAAVKAGDCLTIEKMKQLLADLAVTNNRFSCPHGRPTNWLLRLDDLERKFKRKI